MSSVFPVFSCTRTDPLSWHPQPPWRLENAETDAKFTPSRAMNLGIPFSSSIPTLFWHLALPHRLGSTLNQPSAWDHPLDHTLSNPGIIPVPSRRCDHTKLSDTVDVDATQAGDLVL